AGRWSLDGGSVIYGASGALGTGTTPIAINNGATLQIVSGVAGTRDITANNGGALQAVSSTGSYTGTIEVSPGANFAIGTATNSSAVFTIGDNANDLTGGDASSQITIAGLGTVKLTQPSNYIGAWSVPVGTLSISG